MATELGSAFISVGLGTNTLTGDIKKAFGDAGPAADKAGQKAGGMFSGGFSKLAGALGGLAIGAAAGAALTKGLLDSINVEAGTDKIQAQLGLTEAQAGVAGAAAGSLYANNYGESMEGVRTATSAVISSIDGMRDASQADLEDITAKALNLAAAFDVDVSEASTSAGILMKNGLAKDADEAMDLITDALQGVPAAMRGEIFPVMDEYGKHFKTLGIDGTTAFGIVKNAARDGAIGMDKIGDALKEFTLKAVSTDKPVVAAFEAIGLSAGEMQKGMAEGGDVGAAAFAKTIAGLQGIKDPAMQAQLAIALFGTPLEDLGTDSIPEFLGQLDPMGDAFDSVAGAADRMNKDLNSNAKAGFDGFIRQADAAMIKFVQEKIMPSVSGFASFLNTDVGPAITRISGWIDSDALPALRNFGGWFSDNLPVITNWATGIGVILIPLFLKIAISAATSAAAQVVAWSTAGAGAIKAAATYVASGYIMVGTWIAMGAQALLQGARIAAGWVLAMGPIGWIIAAVVGLAALIFANWDSISKWTSEAWGDVSKVLTDWGTNTIGMFSDFFGKIAAGFGAGLRIVQTIFSTAWEIIQTYVATGLAILIAIFTGQFDKIPAYLESAWLKISGFFMAGVAAIDSILGGGITATVNFFMGIFNAAVAWVAGIPQRFMDGLAALGQLAGTVGGWIAAVKAAAIGKFLELVVWVRSVPGMVLSGIIALAALPGIVGGWIGSVKDAAVGKFLELVAWVRGVPGMITSALGDMRALLLNAGVQIIAGFLKGLQDGFKSVQDFVGGIGQWIADHKGPKAYDLALLVPAGGWIMDGLESGIEGSMPSLRKTLGGVSATIATGITGANYSPAYTPAAVGTASGAGVNANFTINQVDDPIGTSHAVTRRLQSLSA